MRKAAPMEAVGCTIDSGQEAKTEILVKRYGSVTRYALYLGLLQPESPETQ